MNLKKNWKRFWTLSQSREGFTLVELIVVIAIMAILAGVAVPAYSGYINKANKAADLQLLGAINTAFGAACIENGANPNDSTTLAGTPRVALNADGSVNSVSPYGNEFNRYFAGNDSAKFKVITQLVFENGVFVDANDATGVTISYGGITIKVPQSQVDAVLGSEFGEIGAEGLLGQVDTMSGLAAGLLGIADSALNKVIYDEEGTYLANLQNKLDMSDKEFSDLMTGMSDADRQQFLANSAVLSVAQTATGMDAATITGTLTSPTLVDDIKGKLATDPTGALADAALAYGMYTAYANATNGTTPEITDMNDVYDILGEMQDPNSGFQAYLNDPNSTAQADLNGYLAALDMVNNSTSDPAAAESVLTNGFSDPALLEALQGIMG